MNRFLRWLTITPIVITLWGCGSHEPRGEETSAEPEAVEVEAATIAISERVDFLRVLGTVQSQQTTVVASRIPATVLAVHASAGDRVRKGDPLVDLDDREFVSAVTAAQAARAEAESAMRAADQAIAAARAQLDLATVTHQRFENLLQRESVSQQECDESAAKVRLAEAGLRGAESQKELAQRKREQAEAGIVSAQTRLSYTKIAAAVSGLVVERLVDPGSLASPGVPLLRIEPSGRYLLEVKIPESHLGAIRRGRDLDVRVDALGPEGDVKGRIVEVVPVIDPRSRTFVAKLSLPALAGVRSGLYGSARMPGETRQVLTAPEQAVVEQGQLRSVLVVDGGIAKRRLVTLGAAEGGSIEVLSGLVAGEQVVLNPSVVADGSRVRVSGGSQS